MDSARRPWWMHTLAASFVGLHLLILYIVFRGPSDLIGLESGFENGSMVVRAVTPDTKFSRAGFRAGDRVLGIDGKVIRSVNDWRAIQANVETGKPIYWDLLRGSESFRAEIIPDGATLENRLAHRYDLYLSLALCCLLLGLLIGYQRPGDPIARIGAWFIVTASIAFGLPNGWAPPWRQLPLAAQLLLWLPQTSRYVMRRASGSVGPRDPRPQPNSSSRCRPPSCRGPSPASRHAPRGSQNRTLPGGTVRLCRGWHTRLCAWTASALPGRSRAASTRPWSASRCPA